MAILRGHEGRRTGPLQENLVIRPAYGSHFLLGSRPEMSLSLPLIILTFLFLI